MLPVVCIFGAPGLILQSTPAPLADETADFNCLNFAADDGLEAIIRQHRPHVFVTVGKMADFRKLNAAPFEIRRRWLHFEDAGNPVLMGQQAFFCYLNVCLDAGRDPPLVSIFTPTYRTGERFFRALNSVKAQHYGNWEWILWDDSDDGDATAAMIQEHANRDHRIHLIRPGRHSGIIGEVKYQACMASSGRILVELDHDDELTPDALQWIVRGHAEHPDCGFYYSDFAEVTPELGAQEYGKGRGYGFGSYRHQDVRGKVISVAQAPNINAKTIRSLVAAPNHVRAWRRDTYLAVGGHNRFLHVADDMDLMIRTFLETRMLKIPRLCYLQYQDGTNTQRTRNKDIQRHVRALKNHFDKAIHDRFVALGVDDWVWNAAGGYADMAALNPYVEPVASATLAA